jgi:hypothetical protein
MELTFLGQRYETSMPPVEAIETNETGTFLGKRYVKKQFNVTQRHQPTAELTYRGVRYTR